MNHPCDRQTDRQTDRQMDGQTDGRNYDSICALSIYAIARKNANREIVYPFFQTAETWNALSCIEIALSKFIIVTDIDAHFSSYLYIATVISAICCWTLDLCIRCFNRRETDVAFYPHDAVLARVFATATCPSVRLSVCLSQAGIVL